MKTFIYKTRHIFVFSIVFLFLRVESQQFFFKNYSVESGLPFVQVSCMFQDHNGYLWSGGFGGLSRFDGKHFLNYNLKSGLIDHNVNAICENNKGEIFVGTNKGVSVLIKGEFFNYNRSGNTPIAQVTSFCKGYHHNMYIGTSKGLYLYVDEKIKQVKKMEGYKISCLYNPDTSVIFIGTDKGLVLYGHKTFSVLNTSNGLANNKVKCITHFKDYLVIGTAKGMSFYNNPKISIFDRYGKLITILNSQNPLWDGTFNGALLQSDDYWFSAIIDATLPEKKGHFSLKR